MLKPCNFRSQCQVLDHPMPSHPITNFNFCPLRNSIKLPKPSSLIPQMSKRQSGFRPSRKSMLELASILAFNLNIFPPPLNLLIEEFARKDRDGVLREFLSLLRGRGRRRKRQTPPRIFSFFVLILICGLGLVFWKISEFELFLRVSCICLAGLSVIQLCRKKAFKEWILGFLVGVVLLSSTMSKEDVKSWVQRLRICSPVAQIFIGSRNRSKTKWRKAW